MFFKKQNTAVEISSPMGRPSGSSSPTPSIAPSLAPSVASSTGPRSGLFSRLGRRDSTASVVPSLKSTSSPKVGLTNNELAKEVLRLQQDCEVFEEQSKVNQNLLHDCVARLEAKEQECFELHQLNHALTEKLESMAAINKFFNKNACAKDGELETLKKDLQVAVGTNLLAAKDSAILQKSFSEAQEDIVDLRRSNKRKEQKLSNLQTETDTLRQSCETLKQERDRNAEQATTHEAKAKALEKENNILATRVAILDGAIQQNARLGDRLQGQVRVLAQAHDEKGNEDQQRAAAMFARQQDHQNCTKSRLQAVTSTVSDLQGKLSRAEAMTVKTEAAKDLEIQGLTDQLRRLQCDYDGQVAFAIDWQDYANKQHAPSMIST